MKDATIGSTGKVEYYTPSYIVQVVHDTIGKPDLDPSSSEIANQFIQAKRFITAEQDGLSTVWADEDKVISVYCNPPGGKRGKESQTKLFWDMLIDTREAGLLKDAIFMCFSINSLSVLQQSIKRPLEFPVCVLAKRIPFLIEEEDEDGNKTGGIVKANAPSRVNALVYVPGQIDRTYDFYHATHGLGDVVLPFKF